MNVAVGIGVVLAIVQFVKTKIWKVEGTLAIVLAVLATLGVTAYKGIVDGWGFGLAIFAVQVFIGASAGYSLVKVASGKTT